MGFERDQPFSDPLFHSTTAAKLRRRRGNWRICRRAVAVLAQKIGLHRDIAFERLETARLNRRH